MKKLSVQLVTWNGEKYIQFLFESLRNQTFKDFSLYIWDNDSSDGTVETIEKEIVEMDNVSFEKHSENIGFAGGHNEVFKKTQSNFVLLLNQDMYLEPDCLEKIVSFMDKNEDVSACSPRLMMWKFEKGKTGFTDKIDSLGLKVFRNRRVIELYTGVDWYDPMNDELRTKDSLEVFGVSGAFPMYRRDALAEVAFEDGSFLDAEYHSYKEDVDLAYRLRQIGSKAYVLTDVVAFHDRSGAGPKDLTDTDAAKNKKKQSSLVKYHSYKNHFMTLYKNEYWQNLLLDFIFIKWYELKKFVWFLMYDRTVLKGLREVWKQRKLLRKKRKRIIASRKISWKEMRFWFQK
ncbi:MAG: glycosyltransferase family 2 protein [Candidatus Magasanikbacteria bacterium]